MKKFWRWLGIVALGSLALVVAATFYAYSKSEREVARKYQAAETLSVALPTSPAEIAEGKRLAHLTGCTHCHGENLAGTAPLDIPAVVRFVAPNLTQIVPSMTNEQLATLLRHGVKRDGTGAWFMPSQMFRHLHDQDIVRIIAWMRSIPPAAGIEEQTQIRIMGRFIVAAGKFKSSARQIEEATAAGATRDPPGRGAYLVMNLCTECHGENLQGLEEARAPSLAVATGYSPEAFARLMSEGVGMGDRKFELMTPTSRARFSVLTADETAAIQGYLQARFSAPPSSAGNDR